MLTSRCDGIGRRDGLKIRWANHPCGFDPRHRHQIRTMVLIQDHRAFCLYSGNLQRICGDADGENQKPYAHS